MTNRQVALVLAVIIRYFTKAPSIPLFDEALRMLNWLEGK